MDDYVQVDLHAVEIVPRLAPDLEADVAERLAQPDVAAAIKLLADAAHDDIARAARADGSSVS